MGACLENEEHHEGAALKQGQAPINTCLLLLSLVMACIEEMEEFVLPELEELSGTIWHCFILISWSAAKNCLLMFCGRVDLLLSIN